MAGLVSNHEPEICVLGLRSVGLDLVAIQPHRKRLQALLAGYLNDIGH